jgi:hypothetical protein
LIYNPRSRPKKTGQGRTFDKIGKPDSVTFVGKNNGIELYCGWVTGEDKYLKVQ